MSVCARILRDELAQHVGRRQLSRGEFSMLLACRDASCGGLGQKELGEIAGVSPAHVSGLVEQLHRRGLMQRRRSAADRRRQLWHLTPAGRANLCDVLTDLADWAGPLDARTSALGHDTLRRLLKQLRETLGDRTPEPSDRRQAGPDCTNRKGAA